MRRDATLDCVLTNKEGLASGNVKLKDNLICNDCESVEFKKHTESLLLWTSELTLQSSKIFLVEYYGIKPWREQGSKKDG